MKYVFLGLTAVAASLVGSSAGALENLSIYDRFSAPSIDATRWSSLERTRQLKLSALNHVQRDMGPTGSDAGGLSTNFTTNLSDPSRITQIKATLTVNALDVNNCAANPGYNSSVVARLIGSFFNTGTPSSGNQTGDMLALVTLSRGANSALPPGVVDVGGSVVVCQNSDCSVTSGVGQFTGLGTANLGQAVTLQLEWDKAAKTFTAVRDATTTAVVTYTQSDKAAPGNNFKQVSTRTNLASCQSAPRTLGSIDASFDSIAVNRSAAP